MMSNVIFSWRLTSLTLVVLVLAIVCACNSNENSGNSNAPVVSNPPPTALPMPPLKGKSIEKMGWVVADGKHSSVGDFKGKVLILDFYATWCEPCRDSIPHLVALQSRYQNEVRVVGLNVGGEDDLERVPALRKNSTFNIHLDSQMTNSLISYSLTARLFHKHSCLIAAAPWRNVL